MTHMAPVTTGVRPMRHRLWPKLCGVGARGHIALTFDDGPDPESTPRFLDLLDDCKVRATFFVLGSMLQCAPGLGREMVQAGHELAVHGWEHRNGLWRTPRAISTDIARTFNLICDVTGESPRYFRPPYGALSTPALMSARRLGLTPVLWTSWGEEWAPHATPGSVYHSVTDGLFGGGTVLLHDSDCASPPGSWRAALGALPTLLDECARRGYKVGPLREHSFVPETTAISDQREGTTVGF
jgi:peptidoglycan-N-acetylglucosamine deacetylase